MSNIEVTLSRIADALEKLTERTKDDSIIELLQIDNHRISRDTYEYLQDQAFYSEVTVSHIIADIVEQHCRPIVAEERAREERKRLQHEKITAAGKKTVAAKQAKTLELFKPLTAYGVQPRLRFYPGLFYLTGPEGQGEIPLGHCRDEEELVNKALRAIQKVTGATRIGAGGR